MIKLTATALIHSISPVIEVSERFQKREIILNDSWVDKEGGIHPNFVLIEFTGDAMAQLDNFGPGQKVTVEAYVNGKEWNGKIFNSIRGRSVAPTAAPAYPQQPMATYPQQNYQQPAPQPAPMPAYGQAAQPIYPQQGYASAPQPQPQQGYQQPQSPGVANLPFTT